MFSTADDLHLLLAQTKKQTKQTISYMVRRQETVVAVLLAQILKAFVGVYQRSIDKIRNHVSAYEKHERLSFFSKRLLQIVYLGA